MEPNIPIIPGVPMFYNGKYGVFKFVEIKPIQTIQSTIAMQSQPGQNMGPLEENVKHNLIYLSN